MFAPRVCCDGRKKKKKEKKRIDFGGRREWGLEESGQDWRPQQMLISGGGLGWDIY